VTSISSDLLYEEKEPHSGDRLNLILKPSSSIKDFAISSTLERSTQGKSKKLGIPSN